MVHRDYNAMGDLHSGLEAACKSAGVNFELAKEAIADFVGDDKIISYYFTCGPFPNGEELLLDMFVLCEGYLYNYEVRETETLHHVIFLNQILRIDEVPESENTISVHFRVGGLEGGVFLCDQSSRREAVRKFCTTVKRMVVDIAERTE